MKYISDGSRLEAPTVLNRIESTLVQSSTQYIPAGPQLYDLNVSHEDQSIVLVANMNLVQHFL